MGRKYMSGNKIFIIGGNNGNKILNQFELYDYDN